MSVYLIADITVTDPDRYREYARAVPAFIEKHDGTYHVRGGEVEIQEGDWRPQRLVVVEFPSKEKARAFLEDPGYRPLAAIRHQAAATNMILADGP